MTSPTATSAGSMDLAKIRSPLLMTGSIESVSTIMGVMPPMLGTSSLLTKLLTIRIRFMMSSGNSSTQTATPIMVPASWERLSFLSVLSMFSLSPCQKILAYLYGAKFW